MLVIPIVKINSWSISLCLYLYAYWKHCKKLNKRYVGKNFEVFRLRNLAKQIKHKPSLLIEFKFIEQQVSKGNVIAKQYLEKLKRKD